MARFCQSMRAQDLAVTSGAPRWRAAITACSREEPLAAAGVGAFVRCPAWRIVHGHTALGPSAKAGPGFCGDVPRAALASGFLAGGRVTALPGARRRPPAGGWGE